MNKPAIIIFWFFTLAPLFLHAQFVAIPDAEFEQALIDMGIDSNGTPDGQVAIADIDTIKQLDISNRNISDLTGIDGFDSLTNLNCSSNRLVTLDVSGVSMLTTLQCSANQLTNLNTSGNSSLATLLCSSNQLQGLDLSANDSLVLVDFSNNEISGIDLSANLLLERLTCSANKLKNLDVSQNDSLVLLSVSNNQLTNLDVSSNDSLQTLICASNQLKRLDVSNNTVLESLDYSFNLIESHDLRVNTSLTSLNCSNNLLQYLNIANGNNGSLNSFYATGNPLLTCIVVDDIAEIGDSWEKDSSASYSTFCSPIQTLVPDDAFEQALIDLGLDTGPLDDLVVTDSINSLTTLDVSGLTIADLTGIEDFVSLTSLNCNNNPSLTNLDLTKNTALTNLDCSDNNLSSLNLKNNNNGLLTTMDARTNAPSLCIATDNGFTPPGGWQKDGGASYSDNCNAGETFVPDDNFEQALVDLGLDAGPLDNYVNTANINAETSLDVSGKYISDLTGIEDFTALESLDCSSNILTSLDVSNNTLLTELICFSNFLPSLDVTNNIDLVSLQCGDNLLDTLDIFQNTQLESLIFDSNNLKNIDISGNSSLLLLNFNSNKITSASLDLSPATDLEQLFCSNNNLATIDISQNDFLTYLDCSANKLTALDLSDKEDLAYIDCSQNFIPGLDLSDNVALDTLICSTNQIANINLLSNSLLRTLIAEKNSLSNINLSNNGELRFLNVASNDLSSLDVDNDTLLIHLNCSQNQLEDLDVESHPYLTYLACSENVLEELDISKNTALVSLIANSDSLKTLNTDNNTALKELSASNNQIDSLDLNANPDLHRLVVNDNDLSELDVQVNTLLSELDCSDNALTSLDVSLQAKLTSLNCSTNLLKRLNMRNGNNDTLSVFNSINNPDLLCIEVDDPNSINPDWQKDDTASYSVNCRYDDTYVPDDNFESAVAAITGEPDDNDDYILTSAISTLTILDVSNFSISDLTGIEDFAALQTLNISDNSIDSVYLADNAELLDLDASYNQLDEIDLDANALLETVNVSGNSLAGLNLDSLTALTDLDCSGNNIVELDLSIQTLLTSLNCASNQLEFLNVQNGNNTNLVTFDATGNPNLTCIEVDDASSIGAGWLKDDIAAYSENCHYNETYVPDDAFEQALIDFGYDFNTNGPLDDYVPTAKIANILFLNVRDRDIADLTGIEDFGGLTSLNCSGNQLTDLDLAGNPNLLTLNCEANQLTSLDISSNLALRILNVSNNFITSLDISQHTALTNLDVASNQLTSLALLPNINLVEVNGGNNLLVSVDANNGFNYNLYLFDLRNNPMLSCILVDDIAAANGYPGWYKDEQSFYKLICNDDDNDGIADADDQCPTTPFGDQVDLFGCSVFSLPASNFTILTTSETCRTGNNGKINITVEEIHPYMATLYGSIDTVDYQFFDKVEIRNVRADTYRMCIRVIGEDSYEQCYTLFVTEPQDLKVISVGGNNGSRVAYELSGSDNYQVEVNGLSFETSEDYVELPLEKGKNKIVIRTDAECQGVFEDIIYVADEMLVFPNPFADYLRVVTDNNLTEDMQVDVYAINGALIRSSVYPMQNGLLDLDTSGLESGLYLIEVKGKEFHSKFKAVKK